MKKNLFMLITSIIIVSFLTGIFTEPVLAADLSKLTGETPSGIPFNQMKAKIDQYISKYIGKTTPGAAVVIVKDGQIIFSKGYGYADVENQIPVDPKSTTFEWGSISKLFTWTSVMQLTEQGKLDLDKDIKTYLPLGFAKKLEYKQMITMRDIMNHAAGFGDYAFNTIVFSPNQIVSLKNAILRDKPEQYYEVGTASAYSNYAASLAGFVVECVSKQPFQDYERNSIFNVLAMNNTSSDPIFQDNKNILETKAKGYMQNQKDGFELGKWSYVSHLPAGSINGTAEDLARFAIALTPGKSEQSPLFAKPTTLDTMLSPSYPSAEKMVGTAHGFFEYVGEYRTVGHGGNTAFFSNQFAVVPEERFGIAILTNAQTEMNITFGLQDLLLGKKNKEIAAPTGELPDSKKVTGYYVPMEREEGNFLDFAKYLGLYKVSVAGKNKITMNMGSYQGTYIQTKPYYYELISDNHPYFRNAYPLLKFNMEDGNVKQIIVGHGMDLSALPKGRTIPALVSGLIIVVFSMLFFFIAPLIDFILRLKNKKKQIDPQTKRFNLYHSILILLGTLVLVNNLIVSSRMLINNFQTFAEVKPHILFNYPLLFGMIIVALLSFISMRKAVISTKRKVMFFITIVLVSILFALFINWHYFAVVG